MISSLIIYVCVALTHEPNSFSSSMKCVKSYPCALHLLNTLCEHLAQFTSMCVYVCESTKSGFYYLPQSKKWVFMSPAGVPLVGLSRLELQALYGARFESRCVRTFHSPKLITRQTLSLLPSNFQCEHDVSGFN